MLIGYSILTVAISRVFLAFFYSFSWKQFLILETRFGGPIYIKFSSIFFIILGNWVCPKERSMLLFFLDVIASKLEGRTCFVFLLSFNAWIFLTTFGTINVIPLFCVSKANVLFFLKTAWMALWFFCCVFV